MARLRPLITAKLVVRGLMTGETKSLDLAGLCLDHVSDAWATKAIADVPSPK